MSLRLNARWRCVEQGLIRDQDTCRLARREAPSSGARPAHFSCSITKLVREAFPR